MSNRPFWVEKPKEDFFPKYADIFKEEPYYITTKYEGDIYFIAIDENNVCYFGDNENSFSQEGEFWNWLKKKDIFKKLETFKKMFDAKRVYAIGAFCGPQIQGNSLNLKENDWFVFTVNVDGKRANFECLHIFCGVLDLTPVRTEEMGFSLSENYPTIKDLQQRAIKGGIYVYPQGHINKTIIIRGVYNSNLSMKVECY